MILYVNGDSNSNGTELKNQSQSWPLLLSQALNFKLINDSIPGGNNPRILRTTRDMLDQCDTQDIFVVIGWTSWEREEWLHNDRYYTVTASGRNSVPIELQADYIKWVAKQSELEQTRKSKLLHDQIYDLHLLLTKQKIPHLFFNALMPFVEYESVDWHNNYLGPYNNDLSYYWYLKNHGWQPTANNHYLEDAQAIWADVLKNYIEDNKLL